MRLSVRSLEAFREIIRCGSVTAAAETLELSQPSVSRLLASLERDLGFPILTSSGVQETPVTTAFYEHCVATLALGQDDAAGDGERAEDVKAAG
jgi:DNA-binding transcriptional LysR family regulator